MAADLPPELLGGRIIAALDAASRLALFRCSHALARLVLVHAPGSKRLAHLVTSSGSGRWSPTLADLVGSRWQPLPSPLGLELRITSSASNKPPLPSRLPSAAIRQHTTHLHLGKCLLTAEGLAAWQLHSPTLWPHLQHLTIAHTGNVARPPTPASLRQLRPIPGLHSFSVGGGVSLHAMEAALPLAAQAPGLHLPYIRCAATAKALAAMPRLTHVEVKGLYDGGFAALLQHATVEHVTLHTFSLAHDWSKHACRWKTLTAMGGLELHRLPGLPTAQLERLTVRGCLKGYGLVNGDGVAALQRLHAEGRLALRPTGEDDEDVVQFWRMRRGERVFGVWARADATAALVRLVAEAGQGPGGITCLALSSRTFSLTVFRDEVAPALQRNGGVHTLLIELEETTPGECFTGLLGALPPCVTRVRADVAFAAEADVRALVRAGAAALAHAVTLTLLHGGEVRAKFKAELSRLAAGAGRARGRPQSLLTLEVVKRG